MDYKKIITDFAKSLDPGLAINVTIISIDAISDAHFVVSKIQYPDHDMTIPFIITSDSDIYIPNDWEATFPI